MAEFIKGQQLRTLVKGNQVVKTALTLPATTTGTLFTVSGGAVLVTSFFGVVSTATGATATTLSIGTAPTVGTAKTAGLATAQAITSLEAGTWIGLQPASVVTNTYTIGSLAVSGATSAGNVIFDVPDFTVAAGTITWTTNATDTGAVSWYITYVPLDTGASVA